LERGFVNPQREAAAPDHRRVILRPIADAMVCLLLYTWGLADLTTVAYSCNNTVATLRREANAE